MSKNNNLAYDYSRYDEAEEKAERKISHHVSASSKKTLGIVKTLAIAVAAFALFGVMIYGKVEISSLCAEQAELQSQLAEIENENISLESELAQKTGLTKVEEYAENELGLVKLEKSQIEYVEVEKSTISESVAQEETNIFVKIKRWFNSVLEYMGA